MEVEPQSGIPGKGDAHAVNRIHRGNLHRPGNGEDVRSGERFRQWIAVYEPCRAAQLQHTRSALGPIKILVLTTSTVSDDLARALDAGAKGVITKNAEYAKLVAAIRDVAAGKIAVSSEVRHLIDEDPPAPKLTPRQSDVLHSLTRGLSNQEIAKQFGISRESVKEHIDSLYAKIGAANRTEAVAIAFRKHLLKF